MLIYETGNFHKLSFVAESARESTSPQNLDETQRALGALKPIRDQHAGTLVNRNRRNVHTDYLDQLPGTARPPKPDDPLEKGGTIAFATARYKAYRGKEPPQA